MYSAAPALLPIFRSDLQARVLGELLLSPEAERTTAELAAIGGASPQAVWRELNRLVEAGLVKERLVGRTRVLRANADDPNFEPLVAILSRTFGPPALVRDAFAHLPGVERVLIHGSWASRYQGVPGPPPHDLDIVVVGAPRGRELRAAITALEERVSMPVQVVTVTPEEWALAESEFLRAVDSRPQTLVLDNTGGHDTAAEPD